MGKKVKCPKCKGRGKVRDRGPLGDGNTDDGCYPCGGTGELPAPRVMEVKSQLLLPAPKPIEPVTEDAEFTLPKEVEDYNKATAEPVEQQDTTRIELQLLECPKCKSEDVAPGYMGAPATCNVCQHQWEPVLCKGCGCEIRAMIHINMGVCSKCDAKKRDEPERCCDIAIPHTHSGSAAETLYREGFPRKKFGNPIVGLPSEGPVHPIELTADMGRHMREQAIETLKAEGFIVLRPDEQAPTIHQAATLLTQKGFTLVNLRALTDTERSVLAQLQDELEQSKREFEESLKVLRKVREASGCPEGNSISAWVEDKMAEGRELVSQVEQLKKEAAKLRTRLVKTRDSLETHKRLLDSEQSVVLPQSLWERLFIWCLEEVNERVQMSDEIPSNVQGAAMVRTAMRTADELWAAARDYRKNPTKGESE